MKRQRTFALHALADAKAEYENFFRYSRKTNISSQNPISRIKIAKSEFNFGLKAALDAWFAEVSKADWISTADVKRLYATASIVRADRIVFNIKGNDHRLVAAVDFEKGLVRVLGLDQLAKNPAPHPQGL